MAKTGHTGKDSNQKRQYSEYINRRMTSPTVGEDKLELSPIGSDVSLPSEEVVIKKTSRRKKGRLSKINEHFKKYSAVYIMGIIGMGSKISK